ncbi:hypothetical protein [Arthrobacter methylotrophus]|uniref:Uncharacterized protein n=1 Tax=Arthrobacter methylotrophus TaxID=121291 RepID=A0ABV5UQA1_9MICC
MSEEVLNADALQDKILECGAKVLLRVSDPSSQRVVGLPRL